jgi:hypothetical protein
MNMHDLQIIVARNNAAVEAAREEKRIAALLARINDANLVLQIVETLANKDK